MARSFYDIEVICPRNRSNIMLRHCEIKSDEKNHAKIYVPKKDNKFWSSNVHFTLYAPNPQSDCSRPRVEPRFEKGLHCIEPLDMPSFHRDGYAVQLAEISAKGHVTYKKYNCFIKYGKTLDIACSNMFNKHPFFSIRMVKRYDVSEVGEVTEVDLSNVYEAVEREFRPTLLKRSPVEQVEINPVKSLSQSVDIPSILASTPSRYATPRESRWRGAPSVGNSYVAPTSSAPTYDTAGHATAAFLASQGRFGGGKSFQKSTRKNTTSLRRKSRSLKNGRTY